MSQKTIKIWRGRWFCVIIITKPFKKVANDNCQSVLVGSNLLNNNVSTVSLARTYRGIPSSSFEIEAIPPSPVGLKASGDRVVLPQSLRTQTVFPDTSSPDSRYSIILKHPISNVLNFRSWITKKYECIRKLCNKIHYVKNHKVI